METRPLSEELRPAVLSGFVGQQHLTGENGVITKLINNYKASRQNNQKGYFPSLILWGPPGCGKTTLARIISHELDREFFEFSAVNASVKEIEKKIGIQESKTKQQELGFTSNKSSSSPIIFIDEIHRFNKAQQDALLPHVENGAIIFIGATTENPSFEVIGPLLSRTRVIVLKQLESTDLSTLAKNAFTNLGKEMDEETLEATIQASNGDARVLLNIIELTANLAESNTIGIPDLKQALQRSHLTFDLQGEEFYNTISALHKAIRGSDPDGALYWLARMLEAGQDPIYIARRLIRCASEDIGLASTNALVVALSAFQACERLGMPECNLALAEAVVYLAKAPKDNSLYVAYGEAAEDVHKHGNLPVPMHIRNAVTKLMKEVGYGEGYKYEHSKDGQKNPEIDYFPDILKGRKYFK